MLRAFNWVNVVRVHSQIGKSYNTKAIMAINSYTVFDKYSKKEYYYHFGDKETEGNVFLRLTNLYITTLKSFPIRNRGIEGTILRYFER